MTASTRLRCVAAVCIAVLAAAGCGTAATPAAQQADPNASTVTAPAAEPSTSVPAPTSTVVAPPMTAAVSAPDDTEPATIPAPPPTSAPAVLERSGANVNVPSQNAVGDPLSISIPSIGVSSVLVSAGVLDDGTVAVPPDPSIAGWFTGGPRPGDRGPSVIMGHVNSKKYGPGVFYHLRDIAVGALVTIETTDAPQTFVVQSVEQYPKNQFPTDAVYGSVPEPALRLITCGGSFDSSIGHFRDNIVVFLVPAPV